MRFVNKTRFAILGTLLSGPASGYDIRSFMARSTSYFWRESDSTVYPMLKVLAKEGKVHFEEYFIGKKKKEIFSITDLGRQEFEKWIEAETSEETPRNEFLLKFFFVKEGEVMGRLFLDRLNKVNLSLDNLKIIEARLEGLPDSFEKQIRLKALRYGINLLKAEIRWLKNECKE